MTVTREGVGVLLELGVAVSVRMLDRGRWTWSLICREREVSGEWRIPSLTDGKKDRAQARSMTLNWLSGELVMAEAYERKGLMPGVDAETWRQVLARVRALRKLLPPRAYQALMDLGG